MEKTTVLTKLDFRTLKYCNLFIMKHKRKTAIWFLVTALISLGIVVWDVFFSQTDNYLFAILGGFFILYSGYQYFNLEKRLDTQLARFFYNRRVTEQTVTVTEEKVIVNRSVDPNNPTEFDWSFITEILEMPQYYMLMVGKGSPIILDRSADALLEGSFEHLDAIIKEKATTKPYLATDKDIVKVPITYVHPEFPEVVSEETVEQETTETEALETKQIEEAEVVETEEVVTTKEEE
ncbi:MAG: hypothetical protein WC006_02120 [Bacilli bacterium]|nr:hypothetical protein [Bacilli bacterium]